MFGRLKDFLYLCSIITITTQLSREFLYRDTE